ncbi:MAG: CoA transferase [Acidimicrobiales bacterium]|nr:CoA transferase [Acidimicrobiales bacterium]
MSSDAFDRVRRLTTDLWDELGGAPAVVERLQVTGQASLVCPFPVTDLASAGMAVIGLAAAELADAAGAPAAPVSVDRVLTSAWCRHASSVPIRPRSSPTVWATISREYRTRDGRWLRLQANYARPRARILKTLGVSDDVDEVAQVVLEHDADDLEGAIVENGGTVAASRSVEEWLAHPQGRAVSAEPLLDIEDNGVTRSTWEPTPGRPLAGIKVLDLTRVLAGPTATSVLAGLGAEVLRIDAPDGDELDASGDHLLGKRWAILDARTEQGRERLLSLLADADVLIHGYRPGALDGLGVGPDVRATTRPGLIEATLDAYGWTGPWKDRRGFDTLLQFSTGLAVAHTRWAREDGWRGGSPGGPPEDDRPRLLPIQVLDYVAGFLIAAAAIRGLTRRLQSNEGSRSRTALARIASKLIHDGHMEALTTPITFPLDGPFEDRLITTPRGPVRRLLFPVRTEHAPVYWERSYEIAGASAPIWTTLTNGTA